MILDDTDYLPNFSRLKLRGLYGVDEVVCNQKHKIRMDIESGGKF